jgi:hypothetical protein
MNWLGTTPEEKIRDRMSASMADCLRYIQETAREVQDYVLEIDCYEELAELRAAVTDLRYRMSQVEFKVAIQKGEIQTIPQAMENYREPFM